MEQFIGEIRIFPYNFAPTGWLLCSGQILAINVHQTLYSIIGNTFGGNAGTNFALPDLQGSVPLGAGNGPQLSYRPIGSKGGAKEVTLTLAQIPSHNHSYHAYAPVAATADTASPAGHYLAEVSGQNLYGSVANAKKVSDIAIDPEGGSQPHNNMQPYLALNFCIATEGIYPSRSDGGGSSFEAFMGEIKMFAGDYAPQGWMLCDGRTLSIGAYQALFALIGTYYGGDGITTFHLPDMRGRVPVHRGNLSGGKMYPLGEKSGTESIVLTQQQIPRHDHGLTLSVSGLKKYANASKSGRSAEPTGRYTAVVPGLKQYGKAGASSGRTGNLFSAGSGSDGLNHSHENMMPFTAINFIICVYGIFPSRD